MQYNTEISKVRLMLPWAEVVLCSLKRVAPAHSGVSYTPGWSTQNGALSTGVVLCGCALLVARSRSGKGMICVCTFLWRDTSDFAAIPGAAKEASWLRVARSWSLEDWEGWEHMLTSGFAWSGTQKCKDLITCNQFWLLLKTAWTQCFIIFVCILVLSNVY